MVDTLHTLLKVHLLRCRLIVFVPGILFVVGIARVCIPADLDSISRETITGRLSAKNRFSWRYSYDIAFRESKVFVHVAIHLIPACGVSKLELDQVKPAWEKGIEEVWSNKFSIATPAGERYPIMIDVSFKGPRYHHDVIVRPGGGRSDELNWNILDCPAIAAHEFGHMLGVFDEYRRGAIAPQSGIIDTTSIMTSNPTAGMTYARHYKGFLAWFVDKTKLSDVSLVPN